MSSSGSISDWWTSEGNHSTTEHRTASENSAKMFLLQHWTATRSEPPTLLEVFSDGVLWPVSPCSLSLVCVIGDGQDENVKNHYSINVKTLSYSLVEADAGLCCWRLFSSCLIIVICLSAVEVTGMIATNGCEHFSSSSMDLCGYWSFGNL